MNNIVLLMAIVFLGTVASAQLPTKDTNSAEWSAAENQSFYSCEFRATEMLRAATNPTDPNQEGYLRAAEAYGDLASKGETCE